MFSITFLKQKPMFEQIPRKSNNASNYSLSLSFLLNNILVLKIGHKCVVGKILFYFLSSTSSDVQHVFLLYPFSFPLKIIVVKNAHSNRQICNPSPFLKSTLETLNIFILKVHNRYIKTTSVRCFWCLYFRYFVY